MHYRNALYQVSKILLMLLIPSTGYCIFFRLGQAQVVEKCLFNTLPAMMGSPRLSYFELMICYRFLWAGMLIDSMTGWKKINHGY